MKKEFKLENLNCGNCAKKVVKKLNESFEFKEIHFDIISKKIEFETKEKNDEKLMKEIQKVLDGFDHGIVITKEDAEVEEHSHEGRNLLIKIFLSLGIILLNRLVTWDTWIELSLYILSYLIIGFGIIKTGIKNILNKNFLDEFFLMSIASIAAMCIQEYAEAVLVLAFYLVGEYFQEKALNASRKSINSLLNNTIKEANLILDNSQIKSVKVQNLKLKDKILVKKGEIIPIDGILLQDGDFDTKSLTGEALYKSYHKGEEVLSGFINVSDPIQVEVSKTFENSTTSKINKLLKEASKNKSKTERFISVFAKYYTPAVILAAFLIAIIGGLVTKDFTTYIETGIIFLVVSCPCGLVLSIPLGYFAGIAKASKSGLLVKGGEYFDTLSRAKTFVFDKTGTITKDTLAFKKLVYDNSYSEEELIRMIASIESFSNHPISKSIVDHSKLSLETDKVKNFKEISGKGVTADFDGLSFILGNRKILDDHNVSHTSNEMFNIAINNKYIGYIEFQNDVKDNALDVLSELKKNHYELIMLTGDQRENVKEIEDLKVFNQIQDSLLPDQKYEKIQEIIDNNKKLKKNTCYIGDGINDSLCLKVSDVGISMGKIGSDVAIEASDVVIVDDNLKKINTLLKISQITRNIVVQNIVFILAIKFIVMILGIFGYATIGMGVIADVVVSLIAILNSIRILRSKIE